MQTHYTAADLTDLYAARDAVAYVAENLIAYQHKPELAGCALSVIAAHLSRLIEALDAQAARNP